MRDRGLARIPQLFIRQKRFHKKLPRRRRLDANPLLALEPGKEHAYLPHGRERQRRVERTRDERIAPLGADPHQLREHFPHSAGFHVRATFEGEKRRLFSRRHPQGEVSDARSTILALRLQHDLDRLPVGRREGRIERLFSISLALRDLARQIENGLRFVVIRRH